MYRAKRKAPAILTEPFNKTDGAFRQKKSLCLISYYRTPIKNLLACLTERCGSVWGYEKLKYCVRAAYLFSEEEIYYVQRVIQSISNT